MSYDIYGRMRDAVIAALRDAVPDLDDAVADRVEVTPPRDAAHGDMATNAAMVAARAAGLPPAKLAAAIVARLGGVPAIVAATVAGPGFINLRLDPHALRVVLPGVLREGEAYGDSTIGAGLAVNVEYVSANPTGPMHIGHCRGAVVGDALANLLAKAGFVVTKEYYINDAGAQVTALAWAAYWRYLQAIGTRLSEEQFSEEVPGGLQYRGDYLIPVGEELAVEFGPALADPGGEVAAPHVWLDIVRDFTIAQMMRGVREDLALLGVAQDVFFSRTRPGRIRRGGRDDRLAGGARADLRGHAGAAQGQGAGGLGTAPADAVPRHPVRRRRRSAAAQVGRLEHLFRQRHRLSRATSSPAASTRMIDVWGADHGGYVPRMKAAVTAVSSGAATLEIVLCQIVHIVKRRPAGADVQARRQLRHAARPDRGGRARRGALHHADAQGRRADGVRPRRGGGADPRQPGVLRAVRARPLPLGAARRGRDVRQRGGERRGAGRGGAGQGGVGLPGRRRRNWP